MLGDYRKLNVLVGKMAEVSRRVIGNEIHRLTVFRRNPNRPLCAEERSEGGLVVLCASGHSPAKGDDDVQVLSTNRAGLVTEKLSRLKEAENQQKEVVFLDATSFNLPSSCLICPADPTKRLLQPCRTGLLISSGLLQEKLLTNSRPPWTRGVVFIHSDAFRSPQKLRSLCTALFVLTDIGSENLTRQLRHHILRGSAPTRGFSWRSEGSSHPHRSRTTYYDVLKVLPHATQSQIKTAYYKESFINHPDKNAGSKESTKRFTEIREAYTILSDVCLRKKYDQSILKQSDLQSAGRPSTKESSSRFKGHQRARHFYQPDGRPIYDFEAHFQAHYGEQLKRDWAMREKNKRMEERHLREVHDRIIAMSLLFLSSVAGLIFFCIARS